MAEEPVARKQVSPFLLVFFAGLVAGIFSYAMGSWWMHGAPMCDTSKRARHIPFETAKVTFNVPSGWKSHQAGGYVLASPADGADERILVISHRGATVEGMKKIMGPLVREGAGGFFIPEAVPNSCFDIAWIQRKADDAWQKVIIFREEGKLEIRIESDGGETRLRELADALECEKKETAPQPE